MAADPRVHVGVAAIIVDNQERIAMLKRGPDASHGANQWSIPGGWVDYGEQPEDTVIREVQEEVGLTILHPWFVGISTDTHEEQGLHVVCLFYRCKTVHGVLHNMEPNKHSEVEWVHAERVTQRDLFAPLRSIIDKYGDVDVLLGEEL